MYDIRAERSAGWSGLAFLAMIVMTILLYGAPPPDSTASPATLASYLAAHHQTLLIGAWLGFPTVAFFLWFAVGLRAHLAHAAGTKDGLPLYAILAALLSAVLALLSGATGILVLTVPVPADDLPAWWGLGAVLGGPVVSMAGAIFVFAVSASMRRHASASALMANYGYLAALGSALSTLSIFYKTGPMSAMGWANTLLGTGLFVIWVIAASVWLIRGVPSATETV